MTSAHDQKFIVFGAPAIGEEEIEEVVATMKSSWLGTGPKTAAFEAAFAEYKGLEKEHAAAVNSCTAAIHLSLLAANLEPGSEVITTPLTFCATANAIIHAGFTPVLADVDPETQNISPEAIRKAITPKTGAILPVHFAGYPCDMDAIMAIAKEHNLKVIEDCAHAIESEYKGQKTGTIGDFGCFSFYVTKNLVTGEGGLILSKSLDAAARIKILALHGMSKDAWHRYSDKGFKHYQVVECGYKYNMMDLQAAIGLHQLNRLEENWVRRQEIWNTYQKAFSNLPITCPKNPGSNIRHGYHLYTIRINEERSGFSRDQFMEALREKAIGTGVHYLSLPEHPYYQERFMWNTADFPNAKIIGRETISLPLSARLSDADISHICKTVTSLLNGGP